MTVLHWLQEDEFLCFSELWQYVPLQARFSISDEEQMILSYALFIAPAINTGDNVANDKLYSVF